MKIFCNKEEEMFLIEALEISGKCVNGNANNCINFEYTGGCTPDDFKECLMKKFNIDIIREEIGAGELQCAACGFIGDSEEFYKSSVHSKFRICPKCGTIRFVCDENKGYIKKQKHQ